MRTGRFLLPLLAALLIGATPKTKLTDEQRVERLLSQMTLDEKIGQLNQIPGGRSKTLNSLLGPAEYERVKRGEVGSYLHVAGAEPLRQLQQVAVEQSRLHIPLLFAMDVIHGYRTIFPVPLAMAASWDPAVHEKAARVAAEEASASGLHWTFTPMVDIARDARWGRIVEGAGEDPYLGSIMAVAQVQGLQGSSLRNAGSLLATAKHFVGYGAAQGGRDYDSVEITDRTLHEVYLPPFYAARKAGAGSFMSAFNDIGGVPMTVNAPLLQNVLRKAWGFDGLVVSDWNAIPELKSHGVAATDQDASALALRSGVDMDMAGKAYVSTLKSAIAADPGLRRALDDAVRHVLITKARLGLFENPYRNLSAERERAALLTPANRAVAYEAAVRSIVLLKNDGNVLPIPATARRIAIIGALGGDANSQLGSWRAQGKVEDVKSLYSALGARVGPETSVAFEPGNAPGAEPYSDIAGASAVANNADFVLLVLGENFDLTGEARSRSDIGLPARQQAFADAILATGKPVAVVLMNGRPLAIEPLAQRASAILETWFLGVEAGPAIADVLLGKVSPGGKLPVSFPRSSAALPAYYNHLPSGRPADPDLKKDTARYHDLPITPLFPFGHGLSYSRFEYSPLMLDRASLGLNQSVNVSVTVRNAGSVAADEVVQLYVRDPVAQVARPVQELRGFHRISLLPGQAKRVSFTLKPQQLAYWQGGRWRIDAGDVDLMVGSSSADIRGRARFRITQAGYGTEPAAAIATPSSEAAAS
ncbi:MAG: beta-glucosidase BglX [Sphingomicrobium sp.]